jgi:hypothetical protein
MARKKELDVKPIAPKFEWQAEDVFTLTGKEWEIVYNASTFLWENAMKGNSPTMQDHLVLNELKTVTNKVFSKALEDGLIKQS